MGEKIKISDEKFAAVQEQFWEVAAPLMARPNTEEATMMGTPCVRVNGEFVGMVTQSFSGRLIVKLPAETVLDYIASGVGESFSPAKKVFKEWLWVSGDDVATWEQLLEESWEFVSTLPVKKKPAKKKSAPKKSGTTKGRK